jgi:hypothetical protein
LLRRPPFLVEPHDGAIREREIRDDEADAGEQLADVMLDFRHDPSGCDPTLRLIAETLVPDQWLPARSAPRTKQDVGDLKI